MGGLVMGLAQIPFIINFFWSIKHGKKVNDNPWEATTLEWTAPSPPPHGNFVDTPSGLSRTLRIQPARARKDFTMQNEPVDRERTPASRSQPNQFSPNARHGNSLHSFRSSRYRALERKDRHLALSRLGSHALRRTFFRLHFSATWMRAPGMLAPWLLNVPVGTMNTAILIASSVTVVLAWAALKMRQLRAYWWYMLITILCGIIFLGGETRLRMAAEVRALRRLSLRRMRWRNMNSISATITCAEKGLAAAHRDLRSSA